MGSDLWLLKGSSFNGSMLRCNAGAAIEYRRVPEEKKVGWTAFSELCKVLMPRERSTKFSVKHTTFAFRSDVWSMRRRAGPCKETSRGTFPILSREFFSRKPPETQGKRPVLERTMVEQHGESTFRTLDISPYLPGAALHVCHARNTPTNPLCTLASLRVLFSFSGKLGQPLQWFLEKRKSAIAGNAVAHVGQTLV